MDVKVRVCRLEPPLHAWWHGRIAGLGSGDWDFGLSDGEKCDLISWPDESNLGLSYGHSGLCFMTLV